jgi:hypothetical protein
VPDQFSTKGSPIRDWHRIERALESDLTIDIETLGRVSGRLRQVEIWFHCIDNRIFIAGTPGPRGWLANLRDEPRFWFCLKDSYAARLLAEARIVDDTGERTRLFNCAELEWYRARASVSQLVASGPLMEVLLHDRPTTPTLGCSHHPADI